MLRRQADPWEGDGSPARGFTAVELVVVLAIV
ncbi:MAG: prepilin-type N-terminal cleavage/methylation domain-containing protein, partial [Thermoanaerobaculia bacterium]